MDDEELIEYAETLFFENFRSIVQEAKEKEKLQPTCKHSDYPVITFQSFVDRRLKNCCSNCLIEFVTPLTFYTPVE